MRYDTGRPSSVIRLRISQPRTTSLPCPAGLRARRPSPMMDLYRKNAFSTRPCRGYPDACFHWRRPSVFTNVIVRSRAGDRGPWPETVAVLAGGTTTVAPPRPRRFVDGDRVIGGVSGDAHERALDRSEQIEAGGRIITRRLGQRVGHGSRRTDRRQGGASASHACRVVARILTGPHDANRQDSHLPMRYDTGRPRAVIRLRISQPRTTSLPCPAGLRVRRPSPMMDLYRKNAFSTRP